MNYILRAVFNRPEMLYLSIEAEVVAREQCPEEYKTLFCIEYGAPAKIKEIITNNYPFEYDIVERKTRYHGWGNILEGFKTTNDLTDGYVINLEDDGIVHPTFFNYVTDVVKLVGNYSVINANSRITPENINNKKLNVVRRSNLFEANGCVINKYFFNKYVRDYATKAYYKKRSETIRKINDRNGNDPRSKYSSKKRNALKHIGWDGLVNRLVDTAIIEEGLYAVSPYSDRVRHIGFYGQNRVGAFPNVATEFDSRVAWLRTISTDINALKKLDRNYNDYFAFHPELEGFSGDLILEGK